VEAPCPHGAPAFTLNNRDRRFLINTTLREDPPTTINVVVNGQAGLK
jgi:hypothetical protein